MSAMEKKEGKKNIFSPIVKYFKEVKSELKKVVFPTAKQTRINTTVVIVVVLIVGIIIGVLDFAFNAARNAIIAEPETQTQTQTQTETTEAPEVDAATVAQKMLDELDGYTYDEEGNAVDEEGNIIVLESEEGNIELNAETVAELRATAEAALAGEDVTVDDTDAETTEEAPEGGNE